MAEEQLGLDDVLAAAVRRWRLIVGVSVPVLVGVFLYAASLPTTWTATATVGFEQRKGVTLGADSLALLVPSYVAYIRSPSVELPVGTKYGVSGTDLDKQVNVSVPPTTATIEVAVTGDTPTDVAAIANDLASSAVTRAQSDQNIKASLVSQAVAPVVPSGPRRRLLEVGGILGALLLGALVAATVERGFPRLRTEGDVRTLGLGLLGRLPRSAALKELHSESLDDPTVGIAVRTLRNQVVLGAEGSGTRVVAVCSAERREGRSTLCSLLAESLARLDQRVLLIDADSTTRATTFAWLTEVADAELAQRDLAAVLRGAVPLAAAVRRTDVANLSVLPMSPSPEGVADLIARSMPRVLAELRSAAGRQDARLTFDVVLIDTPALLARDEASLLAGLSDGAVLVADSGRQTAAVRRALAALLSAGGHPLGVVLNRSTRRAVVSGGTS